jgi:hypothetical protein
MIREHFHYNKVKRDIFQSLELLVIDEISMVRADLFDAELLYLSCTNPETSMPV